MGRSVSICKVFMIPQICFMVRPKRAARKKLMVSDPVRVLSRVLNSALVLLVEARFAQLIMRKYLSHGRAAEGALAKHRILLTR